MILVTGGTGYIGSHTVLELLNKNHEVLIVDNLINSDVSVLEKIKRINSKDFIFENVDICEMSALKNVFHKYKIDSVIHFAAYKSVGESVKEPLKYYYNNLQGLTNILDCCNIFKVENFVFSSSCTVYGEPKNISIDESGEIANPSSPYGNTKKIGEEIIRDFTNVNKIKAINLRYFNPIGAHKSALLGDKPIGIPNNLIPYVTRVAKGDLEYLNVFGSDYPTDDGTCIRDYIHVLDVASAHVNALEFFEKMKFHEVEIFNLGTGKGVSVLEVIKSFEKVSGVKINYKFSPRRPGDISAIFANPRKAKLKLNWEAKLSLEEMLSSAWNFEKNIIN